MNLVKTLARVAMGVMVARGVGKMLGGRSNRSSSPQTGGSGGLGGLLGGGMRRPSSTGSRDIGRGIGGSDGVGGLSRGNSPSSGSTSTGGLGGLLGGVTGGQSQPSSGSQGGSTGSGSSGGLADILGSVLGGRTGTTGSAQPSGGLGDLLESLGGGRSSTAQGRSAGSGSLGDLLNQAFGGRDAEPPPEQNAHAEILLRGMLNAAKSDGKFDSAEQQKVLQHLGDVSEDELAFVREEMGKPLDVDVYVHSVPRGLEQQAYVMSVLGIELDSQAEAQYLDKLARGLGINADQVNAIHEQLGVPNLYS